MLLSVYMLHSGHDEEDFFVTLETVRCATDFFTGSDMNIK